MDKVTRQFRLQQWAEASREHKESVRGTQYKKPIQLANGAIARLLTTFITICNM